MGRAADETFCHKNVNSCTADLPLHVVLESHCAAMHNYYRRSFSPADDWHPVRSGIYYGSKTRCLISCFRCCRFCRNSYSKLITVEPVIFLYMLATYLFTVIFQLYSFNTYGREALMRFGHSHDVANNTCLNTTILDHYGGPQNNTGDDVEGSTAVLTLIVGVAGQIPSIVASLILGPLSDRYGRKPTMVVPLLGMSVQATLSILIIKYDLNLYYFLLSTAIRGASGGVAGILTACYSYVADISSQRWLTVRLGLLEATNFIAGTVGLVIGGAWVQYSDCDFLSPSWLFLCCVIAALPYVLIVLPESVERNGDNVVGEEPKPKMFGGPKSLFRGLQIFFCKGYSRWKLWFSLLTMAIAFINTTGTIVIMTLFLLHKPLQWDPILIGSYLAASELIHGLSLIIFLPILVVSGVPDTLIVLTGIGLSCAMDLCLGFVVETWQMFVVGAIQGVDALVIPALKAIMSRLVEPEDQGALFSFISATQVLATVVAYVVYALSYSRTLLMGWPAGTSFYLMAILYVVPVPFVILLLIFHKRDDSSSPSRALRCRSTTSSSPSTPSIFRSYRDTSPIETSSSQQQVVDHELGQEAIERQSLLSSASHEFQRSYSSIYNN